MPYTLEATVVSWDTLSPIVEELSGQISVGNVVGIMAAICGIAVGFVFMWWAGRKGLKTLLKSFKSGKLSL